MEHLANGLHTRLQAGVSAWSGILAPSCSQGPSCLLEISEDQARPGAGSTIPAQLL